MRIRNLRPWAVDIADVRFEGSVPAGGVIDVPAPVAGRPPTGEPGDEGYDPGEGLLAQPANWAAADEPEPKAAKSRKEADR